MQNFNVGESCAASRRVPKACSPLCESPLYSSQSCSQNPLLVLEAQSANCILGSSSSGKSSGSSSSSKAAPLLQNCKAHGGGCEPPGPFGRLDNPFQYIKMLHDTAITAPLPLRGSDPFKFHWWLTTRPFEHHCLRGRMV